MGGGSTYTATTVLVTVGGVLGSTPSHRQHGASGCPNSKYCCTQHTHALSMHGTPSASCPCNQLHGMSSCPTMAPLAQSPAPSISSFRQGWVGGSRKLCEVLGDCATHMYTCLQWRTFPVANLYLRRGALLFTVNCQTLPLSTSKETSPLHPVSFLFLFFHLLSLFLFCSTPYLHTLRLPFHLLRLLGTYLKTPR